jgi:pimeloyl-ACP methyl ester carboxylesterase
MPLANINGNNIHYQCVGEGPDVVMIHGLAANLAFWYFSVVPALAKDFHVTAYDLRGHGKSSMPPHGYSSVYMAFDLYVLMDHLGLAKAHLVGHSFGGEVALQYAALYPERVTSLTLADARVRALQPVQRLKDWPGWRSVQRSLAISGVSISEDEQEVGHRLLEEFAHSKWCGTGNAFREEAGFFVPFSLGLSQGKRTAQRWLQLFRTTTAKEDFRSLAGLTGEKIRQIQHPVLAMYGEKSRCLPTLRGLQKILPHCQTVMIPGVGHFHPVQEPRMFVKSLRAFLLGLANRSAPDYGIYPI